MKSPSGAFSFRIYGRGCIRNTLSMNRFLTYLKDTKAELDHVSWPTSKQALIYTALVVAVSLLVSLYLGLFDYIFTTALNWVIG